MANSAFKSTTRRSTSDPPPDKPRPIKRSQSVSAVSRTQSNPQLISEFLNKRDNPLFCSAKEETPTGSGGIGKEVPSERVGRSVSRRDVKKEVGRRGRSVSRPHYAASQLQSGPSDVKKGVGVGRRGRSVSRPHYAASQVSESEGDYAISSSYSFHKRDLNKPESREKGVVADNFDDMHKSTEPSVNSAPYLEIPDWEDMVSTGSLTEAEEKTIRAVCEQMKGDYVGEADSPSNRIYETVRSEVRRAILDIQSDLESAVRRNNTHAMTSTSVADIPSDLVNPGAVELVSDIRKEYAKKLEESQERATKLREDLASEEHRGQEFSRILKEIIPDPKTSKVQKSRPGRRRSNERKNMSKRLTEEAMAYFDECVSISTFDSSDFSAADDPPFNLVEAGTPVGEITSHTQDCSSILTSYHANNSQNHNQDFGVMNSLMDSGLAASSGSNEPVTKKELGGKSRFSFSQKPTKKGGLQQDIMSYVKNINKEFVETTTSSEDSRPSDYDIDLYKHAGGDNLPLEMVLSKNRLECGSLHLCGGGLATMFPPFASVI